MDVVIKKLKREKKHKKKVYKDAICVKIKKNGKRCKHKAVGKGTLCKKHGGNVVIKENLVPTHKIPKHTLATTKFDPSFHPMQYIYGSSVGRSEVEMAAEFRVALPTLQGWAQTFEDFNMAYEIGKALHESWWLQQGKSNLTNTRFSTPLYKFLTMNKLGFSDKIESKNTNINSHGVLLVPASMTNEEWEQDDGGISKEA